MLRSSQGVLHQQHYVSFCAYLLLFFELCLWHCTFRSYLKVITFVKHKRKTSFIELNLVKSTRLYWGTNFLLKNLEIYITKSTKILLDIALKQYASLRLVEFRMQKLAKELGVVIPVSFFEEANNAQYNSVVVIDADGTDLGLYRKSHIPDGSGLLSLIDASKIVFLAEGFNYRWLCFVQVTRRSFISTQATLVLRLGPLSWMISLMLIFIKTILVVLLLIASNLGDVNVNIYSK